MVNMAGFTLEAMEGNETALGEELMIKHFDNLIRDLLFCLMFMVFALPSMAERDGGLLGKYAR